MCRAVRLNLSELPNPAPRVRWAQRNPGSSDSSFRRSFGDCSRSHHHSTRRRRQGQPYFLRGFNLDHGTDIAIFLDDMPLNLPSHAHGEGYSDMNTVIPEFGEAGGFRERSLYRMSATLARCKCHVEFFKTPARELLQGGRRHAYLWRAVFGASQKLGSGNLLYGGEAYYYDGPWVHPDGLTKSRLTNLQPGR